MAVKWVVQEEQSNAAMALLDVGATLHAPAHWLAEVANALWAKSDIRALLSQSQAEARVAWLADLPVKETPLPTLLGAATQLAFELRLTVYDSLYLALAQRLDVRLITADRRLFESARAKPGLAPLVAWITEPL